MLRFTVDVTAADAESRTIEGLAVPYGEVAILNGSRYTFEPGSLALARARTPLLLQHDPSRPIGVLAEHGDREDGLGVRFAIDSTPDGDAAIAQAQSGSRGGLSIGAEVDAFTELEGGVRSVTAARILEVSLVSLSAFEGAGVERVAAELEPDDDDDDDGDDAGDEKGDPPATEGEEEMQDSPLEAGAAPVVLAAAARPTLTAGEYVLAIAGAQRGDSAALAVVQAALTESTLADLTGVLPPSYQTEILGGKVTPRTLSTVFGGRPLPSSGLAIVKPVWGVTPAGDWLTPITGDAPSNAATISTQQADVRGWAWGVAIPYMLATRSDPDVITAMYSQAVEDFYDDVEQAIADELTGAAAGAGSTLGALIAEYYDASGTNPDVIVAAPDVWGALADAKQLDQATGLGSTVSAAGGLAASFAGLPFVVSGKLAAGAMILATRRAIDARVTNPVKMTANAIGALNVELGVVGEAVVDTDWPNELMQATPPLPLGRSGKGSNG